MTWEGSFVFVELCLVKVVRPWNFWQYLLKYLVFSIGSVASWSVSTDSKTHIPSLTISVFHAGSVWRQPLQNNSRPFQAILSMHAIKTRVCHPNLLCLLIFWFIFTIFWKIQTLVMKHCHHKSFGASHWECRTNIFFHKVYWAYLLQSQTR